jgi:hypothetical protein
VQDFTVATTSDDFDLPADGGAVPTAAEIAAAVWSADQLRTLSGASRAAPPDAYNSAQDIDYTAHKNGSARLLARVHLNGADITQAAVVSLAYSIFLLDDGDPDFRTAVAGHEAVAINAADVIFDALRSDADAGNYNFLHAVPIDAHPAFTIAGRNYLVEYTIHPAQGQPVLVRFRVNVV